MMSNEYKQVLLDQLKAGVDPSEVLDAAFTDGWNEGQNEEHARLAEAIDEVFARRS